MYGQQMLDRLKSNKDTNGNELLLEKTRGTFTGSAIGLFIGLYIGYSRHYNLLMSAFIGAAIGGLVTRSFINDKK